MQKRSYNEWKKINPFEKKDQSRKKSFYFAKKYEK